MVFVPGAVLLLVEGRLRLFGYGYPTAFLLPGEVKGERVGGFQFGGGWAALSRGGSYRLAGLTSERSVARFSMSSFRLSDLGVSRQPGCRLKRGSFTM